MKPKVILQFTCMHSTKYGAVERYFKETASLCTEKGYTTIMQYESMPQSSEYCQDVKDTHTEIRVFPIPLSPIGSFFRVFKIIKEVQPEIIHVHFAERFVKLWIPIIGRWFGARRVIHSMHNIPEYPGKTSARHIYNLYDYTLPVSQSAEKGCKTGGFDMSKVKTHYLGLFGDRPRSAELRESYRQKFGIPDDAIVVGCIAFDTPFKGLEGLLKSVKLASEQHPNLHLIEIGVDPAASKLPALAEELGITNRVHWAGIIDNGWQVLNAADFYIQPSTFSEGLGLSIVEAMALKLPVIGTNIGGIPEAVKDGVTGIITEPTPEAIAKAIDTMIQRRDDWDTLGQAGYDRYRRIFDGMESVRQQLIQFYGI